MIPRQSGVSPFFDSKLLHILDAVFPFANHVFFRPHSSFLYILTRYKSASLCSLCGNLRPYLYFSNGTLPHEFCTIKTTPRSADFIESQIGRIIRREVFLQEKSARRRARDKSSRRRKSPASRRRSRPRPSRWNGMARREPRRPPDSAGPVSSDSRSRPANIPVPVRSPCRSGRRESPVRQKYCVLVFDVRRWSSKRRCRAPCRSLSWPARPEHSAPPRT